MPSDRNERLAQLVRFAAVGGLSTFVFMAGQYLFIGVIGLATMVGTTIGFGVSLLASYFGHHTVTFRRSGAHLHIQVCDITAIMLIVSNLVDYGLLEAAGLNYLIASAAISILYPVGSSCRRFGSFPPSCHD